MGYNTYIDGWNVYFKSMEDFVDYLKDEEGIIKKLKWDCPLCENFGALEVQKDGKIFAEIETGEPFRMYERDKWLPYASKFLIGEFTAFGEDHGDIWKVVFDGEGGYKVLEGKIIYGEGTK